MSHHPVDIHIGNRVREARLARNLTQTELGVAVGVSFQQIQKNEKGTNRIAGSRLWMLGNALRIPVTYFFEGLDKTSGDRPASKPISDRVMRVARILDALPDTEAKQEIFALVCAITKA